VGFKVIYTDLKPEFLVENYLNVLYDLSYKKSSGTIVPKCIS